MLNKWLNRWKRCSGNEKPLKLIKEWYSSCEYVDSWRGVHLHLGGRGSINLPCTTMGVWLSLYVRGSTLIRLDYFGRNFRFHWSLWYRLPGNIRERKQRRRRRQWERQENNRFIQQNNNFARAAHFFVHFFAVTARQRRENAWFHVLRGTGTQGNGFLFLFVNLQTVL